jgi:GlpG protein
VPRAQSWFAGFQANPEAAEFQGTSAEAARVREAEARAAAKPGGRIHTRRTIFASTSGYGAGTITYGLIVVCVVVGLLSRLGHDDTLLRHLFISYPDEGSTGFLPEVRGGQLWRLFTPMFIHFGVLHLMFNMLWLFQLGNMLEGRQGHLHFALLVAGLAAASNVAQYAVHGPDFGGMSGVIYGLFGYIWIRGRLDPGSGLFIDPRTALIMIVWFFACMTGLLGQVANVAHGTGLILGSAYGFLSAKWALRR